MLDFEKAVNLEIIQTPREYGLKNAETPSDEILKRETRISTQSDHETPGNLWLTAFGAKSTHELTARISTLQSRPNMLEDSQVAKIFRKRKLDRQRPGKNSQSYL